ncbi:GEVED domain-containing protein [Pseudoalteromonas luteoviolacea]|uniref:PKD domain-containing protein n=1 Tax=Pseudoalteromonas luteoviolacea S4054 TaxID=1129367 RepID=A0A0F6AG60_9GAMM|nr:M4 family metallopeptidase [Pseudoalteromonas luteoviolacea]AOT09947.1 hypothetical protein S4054249_19905 [Pseudoalteromonas luteoviolacea]AOT14858.1 hypothetical protein S40542_19875 [Pseudoalteromonas luteoviolacea]AOT19774.1 hypothetical protein S4054_19880 [Pseudoalteromonas luteoviolacea]KKE85200.1 hypothetical protein N479_05565 [Pseudoalteromonas luteoviolacea S4054]KZN63970.1 hypothetical protein N481_02810 [Pseudoalteromonas luteoviolacea S4047-1]
MRISGFPFALGMVSLSIIGASGIQAAELKPIINQEHLWGSQPSSSVLKPTYFTSNNESVPTTKNTSDALEHRLVKVKGEKTKYEHYQTYFNGYPVVDGQFVLIKNDDEIIQGLGQILSLNKSSQFVGNDIFQFTEQRIKTQLASVLKTAEDFSFSKVYKVWKGSLIPAFSVRVTHNNKIEEQLLHAVTLQVLDKKSAVDKLTPTNAEYVAAGGIGGNEKLGAICYSPSPSSMTNCLAYQFDQYTNASTELVFEDTTVDTPLIFNEFGGYPFIVKKEGNQCFFENQYVKTIDYPVDQEAAFSFDCSTSTEHFNKTQIDDFYWYNFSYSGLNDAHFYGGLVMQYYHKLFADLYPSLNNDCSYSGYCIKQLMQRVSNDSLGSAQAFWDDTYTNYGTGDGGATSYAHTTLSLIAHESAHAITYWNSGLAGNGEAGAFNEAFSDIASIAALSYLQAGVSGSYTNSKAFLDQTSDNSHALKDRKWWYGWDVFYSDVAGRHFALPSADGKGLDHLSMLTPGESHYNIAGLFRKAFYELVKSKNWSVEEAFKLFIKANVDCLPSNASLADASFCLVSQASSFNANRTSAQAKNDVDNVLVSVGLVAQNSNKSTFDLDIFTQYDEIAFDLTTIPANEIAQIDINWGDGTSDSWSSDSGHAIQPYLTRKQAVAVDALNLFELTVTKHNSSQLYAGRHYFSKAYNGCAPDINSANTLLPTNVSLNDTPVVLTAQSYQSVTSDTAVLNRGTQNILFVGQNLNGQSVSVLFDSNHDGIFSPEEALTQNATVSNGQITFNIDSQVRLGKSILRLAIGSNYDHFTTCGYLSSGQVVDFQVKTEQPPIPISAGFDYTILDGNKVKFTNTTTLDDTRNPAYHWDFGFDTPTSDRKNPADVQYPDATESYNVTLTVNYQDGSGESDTVSKQINITAQPPGSDLCSVSRLAPSYENALYIDELSLSTDWNNLTYIDGSQGSNASGYGAHVIDASFPQQRELTVNMLSNVIPKSTAQTLIADTENNVRFTIWLDADENGWLKSKEANFSNSRSNYLLDCNVDDTCRIKVSHTLRLPSIGWVPKRFTLRAKLEEYPLYNRKSDGCKNFYDGEVADVNFKVRVF